VHVASHHAEVKYCIAFYAREDDFSVIVDLILYAPLVLQH
jgi:hypothetical protein